MKMKRKSNFFGMLISPFLILTLLSVSMFLFAHRRTMSAMKDSVEKSRIQLTNNIANSVGNPLKQICMNATSLALQLDKAVAFKSQSLTMYNNTINQLVNMQISNETMLNPIVSRGYVFLFDENKAFNLGSTVQKADEFYEKYMRINNCTYEEFRSYYTQNYFNCTLIPEVQIGYLNEAYQGWLVAQSVPTDPNGKTRGVILFSLDMYDLSQSLLPGVADEKSLCMMVDKSNAMYLCQGDDNVWTTEEAVFLLAQLPEDPSGCYYLHTTNGTEHLVVAAESMNLLFVTVQPTRNAMGNLTVYNFSVILTGFSMLFLAVTVATHSAHRNVRLAKLAIDSISPGNQPDSATNIFEYMRKAILSAQEKEMLLSAHADQQQKLLRTIFLKRLLRGEFLLESDMLREQQLSGILLDGKYYVVFIIHFWQPDTVSPENHQEIRRTLNTEFGSENIQLIEISADNLVCLFLSEEMELRESIESAVERLSKHMSISCFVSSTVTHRMDIPRAYREAHMMIRMCCEEDSGALMWYCDLFQDDAMYNFEYSQYIETKLRNTIAAGNAQSTEQILDDLYRNSVKDSIRSVHVLRFFAYDLYRLINHIEGNVKISKEKKDFRIHLQEKMDYVIDHPESFDNFFAEIKQFCLKICQQNRQRQQQSGGKLILRVQEYINTEFSNPLLSVSSIAEQFKLSDKYLSQLFHEQVNETISSYIESRRLSYACSLLKNTDMTVNEVALSSGYVLTHTFRVAFKKKTGVTPIQWKNSSHNTAK